jgi:hypothetical protein
VLLHVANMSSRTLSYSPTTVGLEYLENELEVPQGPAFDPCVNSPGPSPPVLSGEACKAEIPSTLSRSLSGLDTLSIAGSSLP